MTVTVLLATFRGTQSIAFHESQTAAETALMSFVDLHWAAQFEGEHDEVPRSENERLQRFFADDRNSYIIAEADLSQLRARFKSFSGVAIPCGSADEHADRSDHSPGG